MKRCTGFIPDRPFLYEKLTGREFLRFLSGLYQLNHSESREDQISEILEMFDDELLKVINQGAGVDYKTQLQEIVQARYQQIPTYYVVEALGPDHARKFTIAVKVGNEVLGRGSGKSKKLAESEAARSALEQL